MTMESHPIRLVVEDDLRRSRLTVLFRILLAIPHLLWLWLWSSIALFPIGPIAWILTLVLGRAPQPLWDFYAALVRYTTHVYAYVFLGANPFPGFTGRKGSYPIDVEIDPSESQNRWKTAFRLVLVLPALALASVLLFYLIPQYGYDEASDQYYAFYVPSGSLVRRRLPCLVRVPGARPHADRLARPPRLHASLRGADLGLRPVSSRTGIPMPMRPAGRDQPTPGQPVRLRSTDDLRRSRLTVFFRLLLTIPTSSGFCCGVWPSSSP